MEKIKVGVIGCGGIANGKHMPSIKSLGDVEIVAFCDIIKEKAEESKKKISVQKMQRYIPITKNC